MNEAHQALRYISARNPVQRVNPELLRRLVDAQNSALDQEFSTAADLYARVFDDLKLSISVPGNLRDVPPQAVSDRPFAQLKDDFVRLLDDADITGRAGWLHAINLAQRTHLIRAFAQPDAVVRRVTAKIEDVAGTFPREAAHIERGRNPGDVLDPYILTATQTLLYAGNFQQAIEATVAHKALMVIEGLMGHLHEDVIGLMRGNVRAPEPRGFNQEQIDPHDNPFPGADVVQPPIAAGDALRVHQVKSKTGSAKGGDGKRLGDQLRRLREFYRAEVFYDALIGNTLRGHRSMRGVLTSEPEAVVLVGDAAFRELTRSSVGPELLLRVYQNAMAEAALSTGYRIDTMAAGIVATFRERSEQAGEGYLEMLLSDSIASYPEQQDSRTYSPPTRRRRP